MTSENGHNRAGARSGSPHSDSSPPDGLRRFGGYSRFERVALGLILVVATVLRWAHLAQPSLWMDEIWSIELARGCGTMHDRLSSGILRHSPMEILRLENAPRWWNIWTNMQGAIHPPFYYIALRWWEDLFGIGPIAVRGMSALAGICSIVVFYDVCRLFHGPRIALWASGIMALSIAQLDFAQDARPYELLIFLSLCAADALVRIEILGTSRGRLFCLALFAAAMALTHYYSAGLLIALTAYSLLQLGGKERRRAVVAILIAGLSVLVCWGPQVHRQMGVLPKGLLPSFIAENANSPMTRTMLRIAGLPLQFLIGDRLARYTPFWAGATMSLLVAGIVYILPVVHLKRRRGVGFWLLWLWGTIGTIAIVDLAHHSTTLEILRYTILASPAAYALIAAGEWPGRALLQNIVPMLVVAVLGLLCVVRLIDGVAPREDWRALADVVRENAAPDEPLVFYGDDPWIAPGMFYTGLQYYSADADHPWLIIHQRDQQQALQQLSAQGSFWLIGIDPRRDGANLLPGWQCISEARTSAGVACQFRRIGH